MIGAAALAVAAFGAHLGTWHEQPGFNNVNPGAYVHTSVGVSGGVYFNSERRTSVWVGYRLESPRLQAGPVALRAAATVGAVTGYARPVSPLVLGSVGVEVGAWTLWLNGIPRAQPKGSAGVHFTLERAL